MPKKQHKHNLNLMNVDINCYLFVATKDSSKLQKRECKCIKSSFACLIELRKAEKDGKLPLYLLLYFLIQKRSNLTAGKNTPIDLFCMEKYYKSIDLSRSKQSS